MSGQAASVSDRSRAAKSAAAPLAGFDTNVKSNRATCRPGQRSIVMSTTYHIVDVNGLDVFYREAGDIDAPALLLLHGFPTAGHMFRDLIPLLSNRFHVVAPDLPGFGRTALPARETFAYSFDNLANVIDRFTGVIGLDRFAMYIFDYGAPTGLRLALAHPERVAAIISQNGNAYKEGLSD